MLETQIPPIVERSSQNWVWLIGLSITAGVILLIVLVGVLWCCGFFKRHRPLYPVSTLIDPLSRESHYHLSSSSPQSGQHQLNGDTEDITSDIDDNQMMIHNPVDSLPIVIPKHSSQFIQQQQQERTQYPYYTST
ncbi:unnamed protein product [Adineta steineri]|uniref:Uncharacterized protein n=1 Tax=Adineta steineri TaxID=433720 RepID=A0A813T6D7_9BILA|nr:unnamed protein product [Adineta steineri]CAF0816068.1 unnamed protein product [Adineta steineri]